MRLNWMSRWVGSGCPSVYLKLFYSVYIGFLVPTHLPTYLPTINPTDVDSLVKRKVEYPARNTIL